MNVKEQTNSRRRFLKAAAYTAPVVLTLQATASHARNGSKPAKLKCNDGVGNGPEGCNPGNSPNNDEGFTPGNPGRKNTNR